MSAKGGNLKWIWLVMFGALLLFTLVFYSTLPFPEKALSALWPGGEEKEMLFVGDVLLARDIEKYMRHYGSAYPYQRIVEDMKADIVVANFESAVPIVHEPTPKLSTKFSVDTQYLPGLNSAGFTLVSLANNHTGDFGREGYLETQKQLEKSGIDTLGDPDSLNIDRIQYLEKDGQTIAVVGIHLVHHKWSREEISALLEAADKKSDLQIVYVHWGNEYENVHSDEQEKYAAWLIEAGADMIVGHHPHVVQDIAVYSGVPVFYSLGNFIFDQYFSDQVQTGLMIGLDINGEKLKMELIPVTSLDSKVQPRIMTEREKNEFLEDLAKRSDRALKQAILKGLIKL